MIDNSIFENKLASYYTLGCKLNFSETSTIGRQLSQAGVSRAGKGQSADICVINTCSVTELADKKCRQTIRKAIKQNPGAYVIVTGCYAQLKPEDVADIEGVDLVLGAEQKLNIVEFLDGLKKRDKGAINISKTTQIRTFVPSCSRNDRTRYFLKVQDGCNYFCSFCTIPFARGRSRNGSIDDLVRQAREVAEEDGKEIVLTGINIGDFGRTTGEKLIDLLKALDEVEGICRYRISSIEPNLLTDEIIEFVSKSEKFAPHFHLPLQSGCDQVLALMKRKYDTELFRHKIDLIKRMIPDAFIGVDVIVGMRGETDEYFEESFNFIDSLPISQLHVFTYSERSGTAALQIAHSVDPKIKQRRSRRLTALSDRKLQEFYLSNKGKSASALFEKADHDGLMFGFTENYVRVQYPYTENFVNNITRVNIEEFDDENTAMNVSLPVETYEKNVCI